MKKPKCLRCKLDLFEDEDKVCEECLPLWEQEEAERIEAERLIAEEKQLKREAELAYLRNRNYIYNLYLKLATKYALKHTIALRAEELWDVYQDEKEVQDIMYGYYGDKLSPPLDLHNYVQGI